MASRLLEDFVFTTFTLCLIATGALAAAGPQKSLRELVRETQAPVSRITSTLLPRMDVPAVVQEANVILDARITEARSQLDPDEQWVSTTYKLSPVQVLLDRSRSARRTPALAGEYEVTFLGGEVTIDGFPVRCVDRSLPIPKVGDELILFLDRDEELHTWVPTDGPYSVFKVTADGRVESADQTVEHNGKSRDEFLAIVKAEIARRAK